MPSAPTANACGEFGSAHAPRSEASVMPERSVAKAIACDAVVMTVASVVACWPPAEAVMRAVPAASAWIVPSAETVTAAEFDEVKVRLVPSTAAPEESRATALSESCPPGFIHAVAGVSSTDAIREDGGIGAVASFAHATSTASTAAEATRRSGLLLNTRLMLRD